MDLELLTLALLPLPPLALVPLHTSLNNIKEGPQVFRIRDERNCLIHCYIEVAGERLWG